MDLGRRLPRALGSVLWALLAVVPETGVDVLMGTGGTPEGVIAAVAVKAMGGGMRQAGFLAAAGIYALEHHVDRLREDNARARRLGDKLVTLDYVTAVRPVASNIVIFDLAPPLTAPVFLERMREKGIIGIPFGPRTVRFTTHLEVTDPMVDYVIEQL